MTHDPPDPSRSDEDDELLADLARALQQHEVVPPTLLDAARGAWTWRTIDAELAALAFDSATDEELVGVRGGGGGPRQLTFELDDIVIDLEIDRDGLQLALLGQVSPTPASVCELHRATGATEELDVDQHGRFGLSGPATPFRLVFRLPGDGRSVRTDWIV